MCGERGRSVTLCSEAMYVMINTSDGRVDYPEVVNVMIIAIHKRNTYAQEGNPQYLYEELGPFVALKIRRKDL